MIEPEHVTYRTVARDLTEAAEADLRGYGWVFGQVRAHGFVQIHAKGRRTADVKREAQVLFGITARQFNGVRFDLDQAARGWKANVETRIQTLKDAIEKTEEVIALRTRQAENAKAEGKEKRSAWKAHGARMKKWRLDSLKGQLARVEAELRRKVPRVCFGGASLLRSGTETDMRRWREKRDGRICLVGSKGETCGNLNVHYDGSTVRVQLPVCMTDPEWFAGKTYEVEEDDPDAGRDGAPTLVAQVDDALREGGAQAEEAVPAKRKRKARNPDVRWLEIRDVTFAHGQDALMRAVEGRRAVTWLFFRDETGELQVRATVMNEVGATRSRDVMQGVAAIDLNVDHVALVVTDASGNPGERHTFPFPVAGTPEGKARAMMGETTRAIRELCLRLGIPLAREHLDFRRKRASLREVGKAHARRLSSWAYSKFFGLLDAMMLRAGVEVIPVSPSWTTVIARKKYARWMAMSRHHAAAYVIGRRAQGRDERFVTVGGDRLEGADRNLPRTDGSRWKTAGKPSRKGRRRAKARKPPVGTGTVGREVIATGDAPGCAPVRGTKSGGPNSVPKSVVSTGHERVQVGDTVPPASGGARSERTRNAGYDK